MLSRRISLRFSIAIVAVTIGICHGGTVSADFAAARDAGPSKRLLYRPGEGPGTPRNDWVMRSLLKQDAMQTTDSIEQSSHRSFFRAAVPYAIAVGAGLILFPLDRDIHEFSQRPENRSQTADRWSKTLAHLGTGGPYLVTAPLLFGHGIIFKNKKTVFAGIELAVGALAGETITGGVKYVFGRLRPYQTDSPFKFFKGGSSFYSGHTITIFTYSTIMAKNFPSQDLGFIGIHHNVPLIPIICYTAGGLVGLQRIYSFNHWSSDVYYGALAGYVIGSLTVYAGEKIRLERFAIIPGETPMLAASFSF